MTTNNNPNYKYYVCEGNADAGVTKVTATDTAEEALRLANASTEKVQFVSSINPLEGDDEA